MSINIVISRRRTVVTFFSLSGSSTDIFYLCSHLKGSEQLLLWSNETKLRQGCVPGEANDVGIELVVTFQGSVV